MVEYLYLMNSVRVQSMDTWSKQRQLLSLEYSTTVPATCRLTDQPCGVFQLSKIIIKMQYT